MFNIINLDHIVLNVIDIEKVLDFYSKILRLQPERLEEFKKGLVKFPSLRINSSTVIDLFPPSMHKNTNPQMTNNELNHFCLVIEKKDFQDFIDNLASNKIPIESRSSQNWGALGVGTSIYFRDPENRLIEVRYYN